ncbi:MAG: GTP-binding protein, partial [Pseudomonadota bacterium]|nr:GTP-binding protein [Pseudomonadota bacterium]
PGLNEAAGALDETARQEALRAHVVVYVCDGDLTRAQYAAVTALRAMGKPLVVALNKTDRYDDAELAAVAERLRQRLGGGAEVVAIQSGGVEEVVRIHPDGREEALARPRPPRVQPLLAALQRRIDADIRALESLRDAAVFRLAGQKLDAAVKSHRRQQAEAVVQGYARKAVAGALVAVGPGTDLLIQGYLGLNMLKELAAVYEVAVREIDLQRFLEQASGRVRPRLSVLLALAGNVFKAFPGVGTVMGGMLHAVAYGLIFDSLGKAVTDVLESRGALPAGPALRQLEDTLGEDLETRARRFARLALERKARAAGR